MDPSIRETEIKLRFESPSDAVSRLENLGATPVRPREFEDNIVFDDAGGSLRSSRRLLRLRRTGDRYLLTYKERTTDESRHKVRREVQTPVGDFEAMRGILEDVGFRIVYRYQKYRTVYELDGVEVSLDETPLGCFVELEGEPRAIDSLAERLGCTAGDYITSTYRELHAQAQGSGEPEGDLLMSGPATDTDR